MNASDLRQHGVGSFVGSGQGQGRSSSGVAVIGEPSGVSATTTTRTPKSRRISRQVPHGDQTWVPVLSRTMAAHATTEVAPAARAAPMATDSAQVAQCAQLADRTCTPVWMIPWLSL